MFIEEQFILLLIFEQLTPSLITLQLMPLLISSQFVPLFMCSYTINEKSVPPKSSDIPSSESTSKMFSLIKSIMSIFLFYPTRNAFRIPRLLYRLVCFYYSGIILNLCLVNIKCTTEKHFRHALRLKYIFH